MFKKGISVFLGLKEYTLEENIKYLHLAKSKGYEVVFSSCHIGEAKDSFDELQILIDEIEKLGMKLSLDISKKVYDRIKLPSNLYSLRLDYGFTEEDMIKMSNEANWYVEINASTITEERINRLINNGLNVSKVKASFNYYPKLHTAHTIDFTLEKTNMFHSKGIIVGGFIPSHIGFRPPMYEGLPTVESHRKDSLHLAVEELKFAGLDEILFGDAYASSEELDILSLHQCDEMLIEVDSNSNYLNPYYTQISRLRSDCNDELLRVTPKVPQEVLPSNQEKRSYLDVTIDNSKFLRYMGEVNIVTKPLEKDERVNVIGKAHLTSFLIGYMKNGAPFRFIKK